MRLVNDRGQAVTLGLLGFENGDRHWLVVSGTVTDGSRSWRFEHPCLTPKDVRRLADWLRRWAHGKSQRTEIDFLEPNLAFEFTGQTAGRRVLRVAFELEARPPWNDRARTEDEWRSIWLEFPLTADELQAASDGLRRDLAALDA